MVPSESREDGIDRIPARSDEIGPDAYSGAHVMPAASLSPAREELAAEVMRLSAELANRDREISRLRERLALYEPSGGTELPSAECATAMEPSSALDNVPEQPFAATPNRGESEAYPTIQHVALSYGSCSLFPPPGRSVPPSQRRTPRRTCEIELEFAEDTQFYAGLTQDISQGGMFIATYTLLPIGSALALEFDLPNGTHVRTRGEVRWLRESCSPSARPGMGIAFTELHAEALAAIAHFCRERPPLYMDV